MIRILVLPSACLLAVGAADAGAPSPHPTAPLATFTPPTAATALPAVATSPMARSVSLPIPAKRVPARKVVAEPNPAIARVVAANRSALREPTSAGYMDAVQVYPWADGAIYRLFASPEQISDIALQPGETLTAIAAGDTVRWVVGDTSSGSGPAKRTHVLVKPFAPGLRTNLIITTDRRAYHLALTSTAKTAMAALSWTYPQDQLLVLEHAKRDAEAAAPVAEGLAIDNLRFDYAISGDSPSWRPLRAFDDGRQVFIEFPMTIAQGEAPPLFVVGARGDAQLVNYRVRGRFYIVDRLFDAAELRLGEKPQQIVRIRRTAEMATRDRRQRRGS